jgi:quercetin dioxygenase-like cupin family protein
LKKLTCTISKTTDYSFARDTPDTTWQIMTHIDEVLKENPLPAGEKSQLIKIAEDDTISVFVVRMMPGAKLGPHYHEEHDEIEYVIRGTAQLLVNDKWVDIKPGSIHFNPMRKVHAARNNGNKPLIVLIAFTPAMKVSFHPGNESNR